MTLIQKDIMPGLLYEIWEGELTVDEIQTSQAAFLKRMDEENLPYYVTVVEVRKNTRLPLPTVFVNASRRFPKGRIEYYIIITSLFNATMVDIIGQFTPFKLTAFADTETAIEAAKARLSHTAVLSPPAEYTD